MDVPDLLTDDRQRLNTRGQHPQVGDVEVLPYFQCGYSLREEHCLAALEQFPIRSIHNPAYLQHLQLLEFFQNLPIELLPYVHFIYFEQPHFLLVQDWFKQISIKAHDLQPSQLREPVYHLEDILILYR